MRDTKSPPNRHNDEREGYLLGIWLLWAAKKAGQALNFRCYMDKDNVAQLSLEDVARGLDITKTDKKGDVEYKRVNRQALQKWLHAFGILNSEKEELPHLWGRLLPCGYCTGKHGNYTPNSSLRTDRCVQ